MRSDFRSLTGIRGIAALFVMAYHGLEVKAENAGRPFVWAMSRGYLAVDLFFCLSGFVLAYNYGERFDFIGRCEAMLISCSAGSPDCFRCIYFACRSMRLRTSPDYQIARRRLVC